MTPNSKVVWKTENKLNSVNQPQQRMARVTPSQVPNQLLLNGKLLKKECECLKNMKTEMKIAMELSDYIFPPFTMEEFKVAMKYLKPAKALSVR